MRISAITGSVVLHVSLLAAAYTLPPPPLRRTSDPITVDMISRRAPGAEPVRAQLTPPKPPPPKVAMRELRPTPEHPPEHAIEETPPPTAATPPPVTGTLKPPPGKVDLTLHALPPGTEEGVSVPSGTGTIVGPSNGGRKPWKLPGDVGDPITGKIAEEPEERFPLRPVGHGEYEYKGKAFSARITRDGRVNFNDKNIRDFKGLSGGFDLTDLLTKAHGQDPYFAEKQAFMTTTEPMRKKMAQAALKERQDAALEHLPQVLDEIWRNSARPAEARRRDIYDTWLDAAKSESEVGDSAKDACNIVETYVRRYLPRDSEYAFTDDELQRLNRGQRFKFAPYR